MRIRMTLLVTMELVIVLSIAALLEKLINGLAVPRLLSLLVISLAVGGGLTSILSKMFFAPIKKLTAAMERIADGDYGVRLDEKNTAVEIQELYCGFNMMANELNNTEILKTDFVSGVSHELKTPINAIEGYSTLLQNCDHLEEGQREYVEKILYNTKRVSDLTANMLLLSKIEHQTIPVNQKEFDLDEQIRRSIVAMEPMWEGKEIGFDVDLEDTVYYGNENLMHHVWDNLLSNAIKYNPYGGWIKIRLVNREHGIVFTIEDSGPGIPEGEQKRIFDKFYQADISRKSEGNGLGLSLVKNIVTLEGGSVAVENLPEGGCRFTVTLVNKLRQKQ